MYYSTPPPPFPKPTHAHTAKERIVGFYSTGPKIKENDLQIDALFRRFHPSPVCVIIDVRPGVEGIPVTAYRSKEEVETVRGFGGLCVGCLGGGSCGRSCFSD